MYTDISSPADNIHSLLKYLCNEGSGNRYVYRGQVKEYDAPLVPLSYRKHLSYADRKISHLDSQYESSLKNIGTTFYGDYVLNFNNYKEGLIPDDGLISKEVLLHVYEKALRSPSLLFRQQGNRVLFNYFESRIDLIKSVLTREEYQVFDFYKNKWIASINEYDKRIIRNFGFYKPLNYLFGTALAQQYGFSSDGLDVTKDIRVACFFATRTQQYKYCKIEEDGIGIIYRFPFENAYSDYSDEDGVNYYSHYSLVDVDGVFERMGSDCGDVRSFFDSFRIFYTERMKDNHADLKDLDLPKKLYKNSRVSRQKALLLIPDEIREDDKNSEFSVIRTWLPKYQYIEDISTRRGVEKFYFKHSVDNDVGLSREELWPRNDPLLYLVIWIMTSICQRSFSKDHHMIMNRLDLIDGGYDAAEFLHECINIALNYIVVIAKDNNVYLSE